MGALGERQVQGGCRVEQLEANVRRATISRCPLLQHSLRIPASGLGRQGRAGYSRQEVT